MRRSTKLISLAATLSLVLTLLLSASTIAAGPPRFFFVPLSGDQEVPARETPAFGLALFWLSADEESLRYVLLAFKIDNVLFSHIHGPNGPAGVNQPVVAFLLHDADAPGAGSGRHDGLLAQGTITEDDLVGPLLGQPMEVFIDALLAGTTYVNVHTSDGDGTPNEGPGDFPGGELRGQIL
jgi:hypothetical protein